MQEVPREWTAAAAGGSSESDVTPILQAGWEHQRAGRIAEAERAYRQALAARPGAPRALYLLSGVARQAGQLETAASLLLGAWENDPTGRVEYLVEWGALVLNRLGVEHVLGVFQGAATKYPDRALLHERIGSLQQLSVRVEEAIASYRRALALDPQMVQAHASLATLLNQQGDIDGAIAASRRAIELSPGDAQGHYGLAHGLLKRGELVGAATSFRRAVELSPKWRAAHAGLIETLLRLRDPGAAAAAAGEALRQVGYDSGVIAYQYFALCELGRVEEARRLMDLEGLVRPAAMAAPAGYATIGDLNRALAGELLADPSLMWEPTGRTTRGGHQSRNLLERRTPALKAFVGALCGAVDRYIASLPAGSVHPFAQHRPRGYGLDIWSTILETGGHQAPHIHASGWLSGVYFVQLPDAMGAGGADQAGWTEFGRPPERLGLEGERGSRIPAPIAVQPREGMVILFPSYVFHRTLPFSDSKKRISIAFDVIA